MGLYIAKQSISVSPRIRSLSVVVVSEVESLSVIEVTELPDVMLSFGVLRSTAEWVEVLTSSILAVLPALRQSRGSILTSNYNFLLHFFDGRGNEILLHIIYDSQAFNKYIKSFLTQFLY